MKSPLLLCSIITVKQLVLSNVTSFPHKPMTPGVNFKMIKSMVQNTYKSKPVLHIKLRDKLMTMFMSLASDDLLAKCIHGKNNNESVSNIIWKRCPKDVYVGKTTLSMGVASAVISFNNGTRGL